MDNDFFNDDDDDDDYVPLNKIKTKTKFKKPKLSDIKVFKEKKKHTVKKLKVWNQNDVVQFDDIPKEGKPGQLITCCKLLLIVFKKGG